MNTQMMNLRQALETLWTDVAALSRNPLVDELGLVNSGERDAYKRAMALIEAILKAGQQLKTNGHGTHFALLNRTYGLEDETRQQFQMLAPRPSPADLTAQMDLPLQACERRLNQATSALAQELFGHIVILPQA